MRCLIKNMPDRDLKNLTADYLVENVNYAFKARKDSEWASKVPKDIFSMMFFLMQV